MRRKDIMNACPVPWDMQCNWTWNQKNRMDFFHSILLFLTFFEHPVLLLLYHC